VSQKIKIMFHIFQYRGRGVARIFFKSQSLYRGWGTSYQYELTTLALLRLTAVSQQEELRAYMEELANRL